MEQKFVSNIKLLRKEFNVSQPQLAKETGLANSEISYWENYFIKIFSSNYGLFAKSK